MAVTDVPPPSPPFPPTASREGQDEVPPAPERADSAGLLKEAAGKTRVRVTDMGSCPWWVSILQQKLAVSGQCETCLLC